MNIIFKAQQALVNEFEKAIDETLEKGLTISSIVSRLEDQGLINFTCDMAYDDEFLKLAEQLIREFNLVQYSHIHYFSEFVQRRLLQMQEEI